jgi:hypothetical protein
LTVTNTHDSGPGSLRAAIAAAGSGETITFEPSLDGETITFEPSLDGQTITLTSRELDIARSLDIEGPGAGRLTVSGGGTSRVFDVASGIDVTLSGLTIANGVAVQGARSTTSAR